MKKRILSFIIVFALLSQTIVFAGELSNLLMSNLGGLPYRAPNVNVTIAGAVRAHGTSEAYAQSTSASNFDYKASIDMSNVRDRFSQYYAIGQSLGSVYAVDFDNSIITGRFIVTVNLPESVSQSPTAIYPYVDLTMPTSSIFKIESLDTTLSGAITYTVKVKDDVPLTVAELNTNLSSCLADFCLEVDDLTAFSVNTSIAISMNGYVEVREIDEYDAYAKIDFDSNTSVATVYIATAGGGTSSGGGGGGIISGTCGDNLTWTLDDNGTLTISGEGDMRSNAFMGWPDIESVIIEEGVASIGSYAFCDCDSLISITIPDSITTICDYAFMNCTNLETVIMGNGVTRIGNYAFCDCKNLATIELPDSITDIGYGAFDGCSRLALTYLADEMAEFLAKLNANEVTDFNEIIEIARIFGSIIHRNYFPYDSFVMQEAQENIVHAVSGKNFTSVDEYQNALAQAVFIYNMNEGLPALQAQDFLEQYGEAVGLDLYKYLHLRPNKQVEVVNELTLRKLENISEIQLVLDELSEPVPVNGGHSGYNGNTNWVLYDNGLLEISGSGELWLICPNPEDVRYVVIEDGITSIGMSAFSGYNNLKSVTIPDSVTAICDFAFQGCNNLTSIQIPDSVTSIGDNAFWNCYNITSVIIPDSVTSIGYGAFGNCGLLESIEIPDSVTSIGRDAFLGTRYYYNYENWENGLLYIGNYLIGVREYEISSDVVIRKGTKTIPDNAFRNCQNITSVTIPNSVVIIGGWAFSDCTNLTSIEIPDSVESIGDCAFMGCSNLETVIIGNGVKSIGRDAFWETAFYNNIFDDESNWKDDILYIGNYLISARPHISGDVTIRDNTRVIAPNAFSGRENIVQVEIPNSVVSIGEMAFSDCHNLTSIEIPDSVTSIGENAFNNCYNLTSVKIPTSITSIDRQVFGGCSSLTSIEIPNSVVSIGDGAFRDCTNLTSIEISDSVTSIGEGAFSGCSLTSVTIGGGVKSIGNQWSSMPLQEVHIKDLASWCNMDYQGWNNLLSAEKVYFNNELLSGMIEIPDGVTKIGDSAFAGCRHIESVTIPDGVTSIGYGAFQWCGDLTSVIIPDSVTSIGWWAFESCNNLANLYYRGTQEEWTALLNGGQDIGLSQEPVIVFNSRRITYTGAYEGTVYAENLTYAELPEEYGYDYQFWIDDEPWDGVVQGDMEIIVTKTPKLFVVRYSGRDIWNSDWQINAEYLTSVDLPQPPYGYTYIFVADGAPWDGIVRGDTIVTVIKTVNRYTVTYTGDYSETLEADYLTELPLPEPPYGYTYSFEADGEPWDGKVTKDTEVIVTKTPIVYTVTYTGDYDGTEQVPYLSDLPQPEPPYGYIYRFSSDVNSQDGIVLGNTEVVVSRFCDLTELDIINLEDVQKGQDSIYGKFYEKAFVPQITVSENATYSIYADADCMQEIGNNFILERYENTFYIKVTAESGRETIYKITVDRAIFENFGTLSFVQAVKDTMILRLDKPIVGNPTVKILFGPEQDMLFMEREAEIGDDRQSLYISGLIEDEMYYFKALATYEDIITESSIVLASTAKFSDCYVLRMISPAGGFIDHENGTISGLRVMNSVDKIAVDVDVSYKATWDLYRTATSATTYENRELPLVAGRTKTAYIRVKAEDGTTKVYSISIYRQTKSEKPQIAVSGGMATITSPDGKNIYYTLDGSTPSEKNGILYEMPFAVSKGTIIRAVAKQENKDEYSDVMDFTALGNDFVTVTPIDVYTEGGNLEFEFFAESAEPIYGVFMIGVYDTFGKMTKLLEADTLSGEYEKAITGSLPVTDNEYDTCKFMLWNSYHEMKPLCPANAFKKDETE